MRRLAATLLTTTVACGGVIAPAAASAGFGALLPVKSTSSAPTTSTKEDTSSAVESPSTAPLEIDLSGGADAPVLEPLATVLPVYPSDVSFPQLWGLQQIDAPQAWFFHTGSYETVVAVVDTGVDYTHEDLYENIWLNENEIPIGIRMQLHDVDGDGILTFRDLNDPVNRGPGLIEDSNGNDRIDGGDVLDQWADGFDDILDGNGYADDLIGWDFVDDDNDPMDSSGHGTHVAGTIGAMANTTHPGGAGDDVVGVAWQVRLQPVRIPTPEGNIGPCEFLDIRGAIAEGVRYPVDNGARIANHSWSASADWTFCDYPGELGLTATVEQLSEAFGHARNHGQIVVAAAGNDGVDLDEAPVYPAAFGLDNLIAVANVSSAESLCPWPPSNYGDDVELAAPGCDILSTERTGGVVSVYAKKSGTSMAAPHVAGVVALVWDRNPDWTYRQVVQQVVANALPLSDLEGLVSTGGRLDALAAIAPGPWVERALLLIDGIPATGPSDAQACFGYQVGGVRVAFNEDVDPTSFGLDDVELLVHDADGTPLSTPPALLGVAPVASSCASRADGREACREFDVAITPVTVAESGAELASYEIVVHPEIVDFEGTRLDLDRDGVAGESDDTLQIGFSVGLVLPEACAGDLVLDDLGVHDVQAPTGDSGSVSSRFVGALAR